MWQAAAGGEEEEEPVPKGIPQFWLNVLRNSEELAEHVHSAAAPLLKPHHTVSPAVSGRTNAVRRLPYQHHETISPLGPLTARRGCKFAAALCRFSLVRRRVGQTPHADSNVVELITLLVSPVHVPEHELELRRAPEMHLLSVHDGTVLIREREPRKRRADHREGRGSAGAPGRHQRRGAGPGRL